MVPEFPRFRSLELDDRHFIQEIFRRYQPETSEWTFTNLYIWRSHYNFQWSMHGDWFILLCMKKDRGYYAFQPVGPSPRQAVTVTLLEWLRNEKGADPARIERADQRLVSELTGLPGVLIEADRDQFDYVYRSMDLIQLAGRKYHGKRNHINKFLHTHPFTYEPLEERHLKASLDLADRWCVLHRCEEDLNLTGEWDATREVLTHFQDLQVKGGVIRMDNEVKAFAIGEWLNDQTATVHIEKADPDLPGLYPMINQQFCENVWRDASFINREQDLGEPGLRKAKLSYYPYMLVEKFRITAVPFSSKDL